MFVFVFYALLCVHSSFAIILKRKKIWLLCYYCLIDVDFIINVLWLFLTVSWVGWSAVCDSVFPDHTHLLFDHRSLR